MVDTPKTYVVITGNLSDGFEFHGPFVSFDAAAESIPGSTFGSWISVMWPQRKQQMAENVTTLIEWLKTLPTDSKIFVDEDGMTLMCDANDAYYELGGEPDGKEANKEKEI